VNSSILCLVGLLSAAPLDERPHTVYRPSPAFEAVIRGQSPTFQAPIVVQPDGSTFTASPPVDATTQFGTPVQYGAPAQLGPPTFGDPAFGGPVYTGEPLPPSTVVTPGTDPFLPGPVGGFVPAGPTMFGGYYFGYEAVFVKPFFDTNPAAFVNIPQVANFTQTVDFDWDLEFTSRYTLGYSGSDGLGGRVRYWRFDEEVDFSAVANPGATLSEPFALNLPVTVTAAPGELYTARQKLEVDVLDAEGTWHHDMTWGSVTASAGVRWGSIEFRNAAVSGAASVREEYDFDGIGPTISLLGRKRLWTTDWAVFASGRLSLLYDDANLVQDGTNAFGQNRFDANTDDKIVPVTELQFGLEKSRPCGCFGGSTFFLRTALESQVWYDALPSGDLGFLGFSTGGGWAF
jgi:hypothetical protein